MQARFVAELFAADMRLAVIAEEDDDGVVRQAIGLELLQDVRDLAIELAPRRDTPPVVAHDRMIGVVRRNSTFAGSACFGA